MFRENPGFELAGEADATDPERFKAAVDSMTAPLSEDEVDRLAKTMLAEPATGGYGISPERFRNEAQARREAAWNAYWDGRDVDQDQIDAEQAAYRAVVERANAARDAILREGIDAVRAYKGRTVELDRIREAMNESEYKFRVATAKTVETRYLVLVRERNDARQRDLIADLVAEGCLPVPMPKVRDWRLRVHETQQGGTRASLKIQHDGHRGYRAGLAIRIAAKQSWPVVELNGEWCPTREGAVNNLRLKARESGAVAAPANLL